MGVKPGRTTRTVSWPLSQGRLHLELDRPLPLERALFTVPGLLMVVALGWVAPYLLKHWPPGLRIVEHLKKNAASRPKRMTTLTRHLQAFAGKGVPDKQITEFVGRLRQTGLLSVSEKGAVSYKGDRHP